ncbi:jacalin-like lectin [Pseudomonas fluorescens]|uniref:jacalin-like lectin n=1 Tax=Pseudomonas fluorescens TaxID=294 RepID=UPI0037F184F3
MLMEISSPDADKKPVLISADQGKEETKVFVVSLASLMAELVKAAGDLSISESSFNERLTQFSTKRKELVSIAVTLLDASIAKAAIADNDLQKVYGLLCSGVSIDTVKAIYHSIPDVIFNAIATPEVLSKKWPEIAVVISETGTISITERNLSKLRYQKSWSTGGLGGESFQDDINGRITGIEVNSGDVIDGFAAYYNGTRGPWHGGTKGTKQIVKFDDDEFIASVGVSKGKSWKMTVVNGLKIKTNKRTFIFGNGKELEERDIVVAGFYGRSGDFIDEIGFLTISI